MAAACWLWFAGRDAGPWLAPAPLDASPALLDASPALLDASPALLDASPALLDASPAPLDAPPAPLDAPLETPAGGAERSPPQAEPQPVVRLYLPAIMAGPPLHVPEARPPHAGTEPAVAQSSAAPLPLPDPRLERPPSPARSPHARSTGPIVPPVQTTAAGAATGGASLDAVLAGASPTGEAPAVLSSLAAPSRWIWPVQGELSQTFSPRHRAIDIVAGHGTLVRAADGGEVVYAEWEVSGFGYLVIVDHGDDYQTYYGHLYGFYVDVGQRVEQGDLLGQLGSTGNSTGPHLHFEIRYQGLSRDPLELLPPGQN